MLEHTSLLNSEISQKVAENRNIHRLSVDTDNVIIEGIRFVVNQIIEIQKPFRHVTRETIIGKNKFKIVVSFIVD